MSLFDAASTVRACHVRGSAGPQSSLQEQIAADASTEPMACRPNILLPHG
jgi:hypothetical protein